MLNLQQPWIGIIAAFAVIGLFMFMVYFGMYRFDSRKYFYSFWMAIGLYTALWSYYTLSSGTYVLFVGPFLSAMFMFFRDQRKLIRLFSKS